MNAILKDLKEGLGSKKIQYNHSGVISYPVTPFDNLGDIDFIAFETLLNQLIMLKPDAICILGSVGEAAYLSLVEREKIIEFAADIIGTACPLFVGINTENTKTAIQLANYAKEKQASGIMLSPFSYIPLKASEILKYFQDIAINVRLPIILYNNPISSGASLSPSFMTYLANEIDEVQFIKDSSGDISQLESLITLTAGSTVKIFNGSNKIAFEALKAGVDGWCTVTPCFLGERTQNIISHARSVSKIYTNDQIALFNKLFLVLGEKGLVQTSKVAITHFGINVGAPRPPLQALSEVDRQYLTYLLDLISIDVPSISNNTSTFSLEKSYD